MVPMVCFGIDGSEYGERNAVEAKNAASLALTGSCPVPLQSLEDLTPKLASSPRCERTMEVAFITCCFES
eukprot:2512037-Amphidinium_carterae.1